VFPALGDFFNGYGNFAAGLVDGTEVSVFVEVPDNRVTRQTYRRLDVGETELPLEVVCQCRRLGDKVLERWLFEDFRFARPRGAVIEIVIETRQIDIGVGVAVGLRFGSFRVDILGNSFLAL